MQTNSLLCNFIKEHPKDYEAILSQPPYKLNMNREGDYVIFNYSQYGSDFSNKIVQEARGIIIDVTTLDVVCWPFRKFSNYGIESCDEIDWSTAKVQEKVDGCIIKLWYDKKNNEWIISNNRNIRASKIVDFVGKNLECKIKQCFVSQGLNYSLLNKDYTYIFEYVSPYNRVIIQYDKDEVYHLGTRSNLTGEEFNIDIGIKKPALYDIHSVEDCLVAADGLNKDSIDSYSITNEGYVVVDANWNRVKIKSLKYIEAHAKLSGLYLEGEKLSKDKIVELILNGDDEEFISHYPKQKLIIYKYKNAVNELDKKISQKLEYAYSKWNEVTSDYAEKAHKKISEFTSDDIRICKKQYSVIVEKEMKDFAGYAYQIPENKISSNTSSDIINKEFNKCHSSFIKKLQSIMKD